jgi:hypothetical protein
MKIWTEKSSRLWRFSGGVAVASSLLLNHSVPAAFSFPSQESFYSGLIAQTTSDNLLAQVQDCIQKQSAKESSPPPDTQAIATQCMFSVVMLNPDGTVRPDARERIAELLKATGVKVPRPTSTGQANIALQQVPKQPIFAVPLQVGGQPFSIARSPSDCVYRAVDCRRKCWVILSSGNKNQTTTLKSILFHP